MLHSIVVCWIINGCGEKYPMIHVTPSEEEEGPGETKYIQLVPEWGHADYGFSGPQDVFVGREPFIYVADTGNDRVVMLDLFGNFQGATYIPHPVDIAQDRKLDVWVVSGNNHLYRIKMYEAGHEIESAEIIDYPTVDPVNYDYLVDKPLWQFTGITVTIEDMFLVTLNGPDFYDNAILLFEQARQDTIHLRGPLELRAGGTGIFSCATPSGITSVNNYSWDFIFCQTGYNFYKVQWIAFSSEGFYPKLNPQQGQFDIFELNKFDQPADITVDGHGNIYVVDAAKDSVFKFSSYGVELESFGGEGQFNHPNGVAYFDKTMYVADTGNDRILRFQLSETD